MSDAAKLNIEITKGKTFSKVLRWGQPRLVYKAITAATKAAPCVLTVTGHGIPEGWLFKIGNVVGMTELNSENRDKNGGYYTATVLTDNTIELNDVDALGFRTYTSGGAIAYNDPVDLTGYTARLQVRASADATGTPLLELTTENSGIVLDAVNNTITLQITAAATAALTWQTGVYDLELISSGGVVSGVTYGSVKVIKEVTR